MDNDPFAGEWFWCHKCGCASIRCVFCKNISCSGGGCDICHGDFQLATELINAGLAPDEEELTGRIRQSHEDILRSLSQETGTDARDKQGGGKLS